MICDLHMHSTCSDGSLPVRQLVRAVRDAGVGVFALTDHDTVAGLAEAHDEATRLGIRLVSGVEISTRWDQIELHILGYGFDPYHGALMARLEEQQAARHGRIPALVDRLHALGLPLQVEDVYAVAGDANPGRPHVAKAMVARGFVRTTAEAFDRYLGNGAPAQVQRPLPSPAQAIAWLHAAGGKAVWAHPVARPLKRPGGMERLAGELRQQGLDGIEEIHPAQDSSGRKRVRRVARALGLVLTGGSDFHGDVSPGVSLGCGRGHDAVPASVVDTLLS